MKFSISILKNGVYEIISLAPRFCGIVQNMLNVGMGEFVPIEKLIGSTNITIICKVCF